MRNSPAGIGHFNLHETQHYGRAAAGGTARWLPRSSLFCRLNICNVIQRHLRCIFGVIFFLPASHPPPRGPVFMATLSFSSSKPPSLSFSTTWPGLMSAFWQTSELILFQFRRHVCISAALTVCRKCDTWANAYSRVKYIRLRSHNRKEIWHLQPSAIWRGCVGGDAVSDFHFTVQKAEGRKRRRKM